MQYAFGRHVISCLLAVSALAGCTTVQGARGGLLGGRGQSASDVYIAALEGGIVGRSGVTLSNADRQRALEAEYKALEAAPGGQPITWESGKVSGEVVAAAPYQVGSQNCRQYTHTLSVDGRDVEARGAACRNSDGTWTPLS